MHNLLYILSFRHFVLHKATNSFPTLAFEPYNFGSFSPNYKSKKVKLIDPVYRKHRIFIEPGFAAKGLHAFAVRIVRSEHSRISIGVAIQQANEQRPDFAHYWRLDCETGEVCVRDSPAEDFNQKEDSALHSRVRQGSVVGVMVDVDMQTIEFAVNGTRVGQAVKLNLLEDESVTKLRAACSLVEEGDVLELVDLNDQE